MSRQSKKNFKCKFKNNHTTSFYLGEQRDACCVIALSSALKRLKISKDLLKTFVLL